MAFKHCLVFLAFCLPFSGAKLSDLELDEYDYDEVFNQLKTTEKPAVTPTLMTTERPAVNPTLMKPPIEFVPTTPMPDVVDYTDYSNQYVEQNEDNTKTDGKILLFFTSFFGKILLFPYF